MKKPRNIRLIGLLFTILLISTATVVIAQVSQTHIISAGVNASHDHTVWTNGGADGADTYYSKNPYGALEISNADASVVLDYVLSLGGSIKVLSGDYYCDDPIYFGGNRVDFEGSGVNVTGVTGIPDDVPTDLKGTVFRFSGTGNLFCIVGEAEGISMRSFGIVLNGANTDAGISCYAAGDNGKGLIYGRFEDISVLGATASDYAFYFSSCQHLVCSGLRAWNSGFIWCRGWDTTPYDYGNSYFSECYTQSDRALTVPAQVFLEVEFGNSWGLSVFDRLQINNLGGVATGVTALRLDYCRYITFEGLDIETQTEYPLTIDANSRGITFVNPYIWRDGNSGVINLLGSYISFFGGIIDGCDGGVNNGTNIAFYNTYRWLG